MTDGDDGAHMSHPQQILDKKFVHNIYKIKLINKKYQSELLKLRCEGIFLR